MNVKVKPMAAIVEAEEADNVLEVAAFLEETSLGDVSDFGYAPVQVQHIRWVCVVESPVGDATHTPALIDNGSPSVFIETKLIDKLGLKVFKLQYFSPGNLSNFVSQ